MQIGSLGSILTTSYQPGTYGMGTYDITAGVTDPTMTGAGDTDGVKPGYKSTPGGMSDLQGAQVYRWVG